MADQAKQRRRLPCGCVVAWDIEAEVSYTVRDCGDARRLWAQTKQPFRLGTTIGQWGPFEEAIGAYRRHFEEVS